MTTYVLVHGGGHGGWCYQRVARLLRQAGHDVYTPTLTGLGERAHLVSADTDLTTHIQDVVAVLEFEDLHDVVLAGHSYGGIVITGVADRAPDRIGHLVYLDAASPQNGQSLADIAPQLMEEARSDARIVNGVELVLWPDSASIRHYGITDPADVAWTQAKLTPHPWKSFAQRLVLEDEARMRRIPRTDLWCSWSLQLSGGEPPPSSADNVWVIDSGHDMMITKPAELADLLLRLGPN